MSGEEHYQDVLKSLRGTTREGARVMATLVLKEGGNALAKNAAGPVLEVQVAGTTVGFLTPAMTERYLPFVQSANAQQRALSATALVADGSGKGGRDVEITLLALPMWEGQTSTTGLNVERIPEFIIYRRTGRAHAIDGQEGDTWLTTCGQKIRAADVQLVLRTKPWVGRVLEDGTLHSDAPWWCGRCDGSAQERPAPDAGGRFGEPTAISRDNPYSSAMTPKAVHKALATRLLFDIAGESYRPGYPENLLQLARTMDSLNAGESFTAVLRRDPSNAHDANAIEVHLPAAGGHCGYVPAALARILAPMLDEGATLLASAVEVRVHPDSPRQPGLTVAVSLVDTATR